MENKNASKTIAESYHQIADRAEMRRGRSIVRSLRKKKEKRGKKKQKLTAEWYAKVQQMVCRSQLLLHVAKDAVFCQQALHEHHQKISA